MKFIVQLTLIITTISLSTILARFSFSKVDITKNTKCFEQEKQQTNKKLANNNKTLLEPKEMLVCCSKFYSNLATNKIACRILGDKKDDCEKCFEFQEIFKSQLIQECQNACEATEKECKLKHAEETLKTNVRLRKELEEGKKQNQDITFLYFEETLKNNSSDSYCSERKNHCVPLCALNIRFSNFQLNNKF